MNSDSGTREALIGRPAAADVSNVPLRGSFEKGLDLGGFDSVYFYTLVSRRLS